MYTIDAVAWHKPDMVADIRTLDAATIREWMGGDPDVIWASPPCTTFSVASLGRYWAFGVPAHPDTFDALAMVEHTVKLIRELNPRWWWMENPRGMLRKQKPVAGLNRVTVSYCQYGDTRQKMTDLWGVWPKRWTPKAHCRTGASCHEASPRGHKNTGTQGMRDPALRAMVPYELSMELCLATEDGVSRAEGREEEAVPENAVAVAGAGVLVSPELYLDRTNNLPTSTR